MRLQFAEEASARSYGYVSKVEEVASPKFALWTSVGQEHYKKVCAEDQLDVPLIFLSVRERRCYSGVDMCSRALTKKKEQFAYFQDIRARVTVCYLVFTVTFLAQETLVPQYVSVICGLERREMGTMCKNITRIEMCKDIFQSFFIIIFFFNNTCFLSF